MGWHIYSIHNNYLLYFVEFIHYLMKSVGTHFFSVSSIHWIVPNKNSQLFIWQVAVSPKARGLRLAKRLILDILDRPACHNVTELNTTITSTNAPSQGVFRSVARELGADVKRKVQFERETHFDGAAASEILWQIGPFERKDVERVAA